MTYVGGSVTAEIKLDTSKFKKEIENLKGEIEQIQTLFNSVKGGNGLDKQVKELKEEIKQLTNENENYESSLKELREENKKLSGSIKDNAKALKDEQSALDSTIKKTNDAVKATENLNNATKNAVSPYAELANAANKSSEALAKMHEKNMQGAAKEAKVIKKYTMEELELLETLDWHANFEKKQGKTLLPIDNKYSYPTHYSKLLRRYKRKNGSGLDKSVWDDYKASDFKDFTTGFQKRMKELLADLGITISKVTNGEFKKIKDKTTGKMAEYLDIGMVGDNKWIQKVKNQMHQYDAFLKEMKLINSIYGGDKGFPHKVAEAINQFNSLAYEKYGKEGNPLIKEYVRKNGLRKYASGKDNKYDGEIYAHQLEQASTALKTFDRMLNTTDVSLIHNKRHLTETGQALKEYHAIAKETNQTRLGTNLYKGGFPSDGKASNILTQKEQLKSLATAIKEYSNSTERAAQKDRELEQEISKLLVKTELEAQLHPKLNEGYRNWARNIMEVSSNAQKANSVLQQSTNTTQQTATHMEQLANTARAASLGLMNYQRGASIASVAQEQFNQSLNTAGYNAEKYKEKISLIATELKAKWHSMSVELAQANAAQYKYWQQSRGSVSGFADPLPIKGYNDYLKVVKEATEATKQFEATHKKTAISLNTYKANLSGVQVELDKLAQSEQRVKNAQLQLQYIQRTDYLNQYKANMGEINQKLAEQTQNVRQAGRGLTSFNNGMVQTAHSGRILSNTLYQIRGALLSLKMILTAMGGMALWGFAMDIAEGVKSTFTAKNELEAQLNANAKVGASGLNTFNKALDRTAQEFKKINKYALGETVSSIGLEFEMTSKQMEKAMPIVAMIQSEYVRAGRTSEEAALAVKDILQGEFQRLSRETGVGKEELIAYGWDEDKTNIDGLLNALEKAAKDRNWDLFAKKATSLNDVLTITKSRFSEFGADLLQSISPLVVGAFNTIIGGIDSLSKSFEGLNSFWKNLTLFGGGTGALFGIATLLPMITKNMGLAEIATMGWGKSILTATFNLNKMEVAQYGLRKALAAVITGTKASELANRRASTAILGRVLGVNQAVQAEQGLMGALVHSKMALKGVNIDAQAGSVIMGNLRQKIIYLTKGVIVADKETATWGKTIKSIVTSTKLWRMALLGLMGVGLTVWLAGVAQWTDTVKKRIDTFNEVVDNGDDMVAEAQQTVDDYTKSISKLKEGTDEYTRAVNNRKQAEANLNDIKTANELAKTYKKQNDELAKSNDLKYQRGLKDSYILAGKDYKSATEAASGYTEQVKKANEDIIRSEQEKADFEYKSLQHINEHLSLMKESNLSEEQRVGYVAEYSRKAQEAAEHLKQFNQGDLMAGVYYLLDRMSLMWIDMWNDPQFLKFWDSVKQTWSDLQPTLRTLLDYLYQLKDAFLDFFSTKHGQIIGGMAIFGATVGIIGVKVANWVRGIKDSIDPLVQWGKKLRDRKKDVEDLTDAVENGDKKTGGKISEKSTGGIKGEKPKKYGSWGELGTDIKQDFMGEARKFAKLAGQIALAMGVVTVAITSLIGPLLALALVGTIFKGVEQQAKDGIEGIKFVAPVVGAFLVPVMALMYVLDKAKGTISENITYTAKQAAKTIAVGMLLVAEAVLMMVAPMLAIAGVGFVKGLLGDNVEKGKEAIELVTETLVGLYPIIPVFAVAIIAGSIAIDTAGVGALYLVGSLAIGMGLVAVAVLTLAEPLLAIGALGGIFQDLTAVRKGAEAIKVTAESLTYLTVALGAMDMVDFELLTHYVLKFIASRLGLDVKLTDLTKEGGFFSEISEFIKQFNQINIEQINADKVTALNGISTGLQTITDALKNANDAINNIPPELKGDSSKPLLNYDKETDTTQINTGDVTGYFDKLKEPLKQLKQFIDDFNNSEEFNFTIGDNWQQRVDAINQSASLLEQVNSAVERVKTAMSNVGGAQWETSYAQGGILGAVGNWLFHQSGAGSINNGQGSGEYKSSLGSSLKEMENVISDLFTFQSNISNMAGGEGGEGVNVDGVTSLVTTVQTAISTLSQSLADAVPQFEGNGNAIGSAISKGIKNGLGNLTEAIVPPLIEAMSTAKNWAGTYGKGIGWQGTQGFKAEFKIKDAVNTELDYALQAMEGKKQEFYDKGYALGKSASDGFKDGDDINSPGIMARALFGELGYMTSALDDAVNNMPNQTSMLAQTMATNFTPSFNVGFLDATDLSLFSQGLNEVTYMANTADMQTSLAFNDMNMNVAMNMQGMTTSVNGAFNNIQANATTSYAQITNTTRTSLSNMQSQTTKNINAIKSSWRGMQDALIASAENIRSETSAKIHALESNMASFWSKVQNPSLLLGAGSNGGTIRRGNRPSMRTGTSKSTFSKSLGAAGPKPKTGQRYTGISDKLRQGVNAKKDTIFNHLAEYLQCLSTGGICAAGSGWGFNWSDDIKQALLKWHTHFGEIYDPYLFVGKFENDDFPVRGIAEIAKNYIYDAISRTTYSYYYDHHYGSAKEAYDAGSFNCMDGAMVAIGFANAFGFPGGTIRLGSWDGEGHGFADIPGLGIIDATAIQKGYGFTSPKVSGYGSKSLISRSAKTANGNKGQTHNYNGDINLNINVYGDDVEVNENKVDKSTARSIIDLLGINPNTGL